MKNLLTISLSLVVGFALALVVLGPRSPGIAGAAGKCVAKKGDVNADGNLDVSDAVTLLGHLFLGSPTDIPDLCAPAASGPSLPATGQTGCFTFEIIQGIWTPVPCGEISCPGQDGFYGSGCSGAGRFEENGDGTVTDTCTGLMWQKETADVDGSGDVNGAAGDAVIWCDALSYCESLILAGHDDWRLPNVRELQSLVDYGLSNPCIDPVFGALPNFYWSSTSYTEAPDEVWGVGFNNGYVGVTNKCCDPEFTNNFVRAVRG